MEEEPGLATLKGLLLRVLDDPPQDLRFEHGPRAEGPLVEGGSGAAGPLVLGDLEGAAAVGGAWGLMR